jgi:hypothetical protein
VSDLAAADSAVPDYVVVVGAVQAREFQAQGGPDSSYVRVMQFEPPAPDHAPPIEFVGMPVTVFRRTAGGR